MNTAVATADTMAQKIDAALFRGDLSKLTDEERVMHMHNVCRSLGLNPATGPFAYIVLNNKLTLYAKRDACDQLRKLHGISIQVAGYETSESGLLTVHVRATDKTGRQDEDFGVVSIRGLQGEVAANAFHKAVTKAKRRVTLSICGLGYVSEEEIEDMTPSFADTGHTGHGSIRNAQLTKDSLPPNSVSSAAKAEDAITTSEPYLIPLHNDDWAAWCNTLTAAVRAAPDTDTINSWKVENFASLAKLKEVDLPKWTRLDGIINHQIALRSEPDET